MSFRYTHATSLDEALTVLAASGTLPVAGGSDLLPCYNDGILAPTEVVDVRQVPELHDVVLHADGSASIGAAVSIADLAEHGALGERFPLLRDACASVGTPALRNQGSLGGNLAQRHHCWYFRRGVGCFKRGGTHCAAVDGEHQYHGIVADGTCRAVHPSDPAVALEVLDASIQVARAGSAMRSLSLEQFYDGAATDPRREAQLDAGDLIVAVHLPAASAGGTQHWEKLMQRGAWDFALASCAAQRRRDGSVRMALGGVALHPWRVALSVEEDVAVGGLDDESVDALAERALYDAVPLAHNGFKVAMAQALLRRAMRAIAS
ncbi:MAG: FAD binding domain-containing protein [Gemmatimonadaceae bacterium]|nr:FAD binding domain-containing protein [Gemmatimonadaceae bacterium]